MLSLFVSPSLVLSLSDRPLQLYKFKKLALAVVFGVGVTVGMLFCALFCGGSKSSGGKKKTD